MIFVQDSLGAQEADTVQHVISAAGAPRWVGYDTVGMFFCFCVCVGTQQEVSVATGERFYVTS